jgi:hypothetical protein
MILTEPVTAARPEAGLDPSSDLPTKIRSHHQDRLAVVYVRQSTAQQVLEHRESAARQYNLRRRAVEWGWPAERVLVIDEDQGHSGQAADGRLGFQRLLAEVGLDHVGLILGLEMKRSCSAGEAGDCEFTEIDRRPSAEEISDAISAGRRVGLWRFDGE